MLFSRLQTHRFLLRVLCALVVVVTLVAAMPQTVQASNVPVLSIVKVVTDDSVTIKITNSLKDTAYTVRMGEYGSYGIGGYVVGTITTTSAGTAEKAFSIPAKLKGKAQIAIRADGALGYYAYNWFNNKPGGTVVPPPPPGYSGFPTFSILSVVKDTSVTIQTKNLPPNQTFSVRMGLYGTYAKGGTEVGTFESDTTPEQKLTFNIPAGLKGNTMLAIRIDSAPGFFAYNWFYNTSSDGTTPPPVVPPGYTGYPTFSIKAVLRDDNVTISIQHLPPHVTFTVRMGAYGSYGLGGTEVGSFDSGDGGALEKTFDIPNGLAGSGRIAIRMDSNPGYFAYNWFYNNSTK